MKSLLMSAIILFLFSVSILLIQTSCSKTTAQTPNTINQLNKIIYFKNLNMGVIEIWTANYDGSGATQVPLTLPPGIYFDTYISTNSLSISPDGQTIFFTCKNGPGTSADSEIASCSINRGTPTIVATGYAGKVHAY